MATTDIHAIKQTVGVAIGYITKDKVEEKIKDDIADSIKYAINDKTGEVTYYTTSSFLNCIYGGEPVQTFRAMRDKYGKKEVEHGNKKTKDGKPIIAWHLIQSFEGNVDPRIANEIGVKLAREIFKDYPVVVSTHTNTENTHNHIMICAWDLDGKKWDMCHETYNRIRSVSDRLCDEYGLSVLENTREQKLIKWEDKDGVTRYYEPTDRKNELLRKREAGEVSTDDVNSYRNTISYEVATAKKLSNVEAVKQAIDSALPYATSYEHLLMMLREQGFSIKDKKKNGDWLAHIVFQPPTAEKGVRDNSIDKENNFYSRENLTKQIEQNNAERNKGKADVQSVPYFGSYEYGKIDVQSINENFRSVLMQSGEKKVVERGQAEKSIIRDIKKSDLELAGLYDTSTLTFMIERERQARKSGQRKSKPKERTAMLISQIHDSFENLSFIEQKQIYSYEQINNTVKNLWNQYNACLTKISEAEGMIERLESVSNAPKMLFEIRARMEANKENPEYLVEQYHEDLKLAKSCADAIQKYQLKDKDSVVALQEKVEKYKEQVQRLQNVLTTFRSELSAYNRCVSTLERIDSESGNSFEAVFADYNKITREAEEEASKKEQERNKKKGFER